MPEIARLTKFFSKIENTYRESLSIRHLIESGEIVSATHSEISFIILVVNRLRLDLNQNKRLTAEILEEMLKGAHLRFEDDGFFILKYLCSLKSDCRSAVHLISLLCSNIHFRESFSKRCYLVFPRIKKGRKQAGFNLNDIIPEPSLL